jgi:signal transduction histidine kinase
MRKIVAIFFLLSFATLGNSQAPLRLPPYLDQYLDVSVKEYFTALYDSTGQMGLDDVRTLNFVPIDSLRYPHGVLHNNDCRIWLRCKTDSFSRNNGDSTRLYWHFNLRHTKVEGFRVGQEVKHFNWGQTADGQPLSTLFLLPFESTGKQDATWYFRIQLFPFRIKDFSPSIMSMKGWRDRSAVRYYDMQLSHNITVCLVGIILFIALFTFVQWALYRLHVFFYYACFLITSLANLYRYEMEFAMPVTKLTAFLTTHGDFITAYMGHTFYFLFINEFLQLKRYMPGLYRLTRLTAIFSAGLLIVHFVFYFLLNRHDWSISLFLLRFPLLAVGIFSIFAVIYKRPPYYKFIFYGGISLAAGALIWMVSGYRIENGLPGIAFATVSFYAGVMVETLFFLSGLGFQFKKSEETKRKVQKKLIDERERITRDLHDDVGSTLNSIAVMSELAHRQLETSPNMVVNTLDIIQNTARDTVLRISDIVWSVNPNIETLGDLVARMRNFTFSLFNGSGTRVRFSVSAELETMPVSADSRWQLYLIFKEAANNVSKYAGASLLRIEFKEENGEMYLIISDNGKGFDLDEGYEGNGLRTMQERAQALGGTLRLQSAAGEGTLVELRCSL